MGKVASSIRCLCTGAVLALLADCTGGGPSSALHPSASRPVFSATTPSPAGPFIRTCESSVYGDLGKGWRKNALVVGPIAFVGLPGAASAPRSNFAPLDDGSRSVKALAVADEGTDVTVSISREDRSHVSLLYDPSAFKDFNSYQISDGETAVRFLTCGEGESPFGVNGPTQFNGGFIVDGPQCVTLEVVAGNGPLKRVNVAFGRRTCATTG